MKIPEKYRGLELYVHCSGCKKLVSGKKARCGKKDVLARNCPNKKNWAYQSRIYNPHTKQTDKTRRWKGLTFQQAWEAHQAFKKELVNNDFHLIKPEKEHKPKLLLECVKTYLEYLQDINVPYQERKNLSARHIKEQDRYLYGFLKILKDNKFNPKQMLIEGISAKMVGLYYREIENRGYKPTSFNHAIKAIKYFFDYFIDKRKYEMINPLEKVKYKSVVHDPKIIRDEEFEQLMEVITLENGLFVKSVKTGERVNYYRSWLKDCFKAYLLIGGRGMEMVSLTWNHVGKDFITVPNFKISKDTGEQLNKDYVFITDQLATLLVKLRANEYTGSNKHLLVPEHVNRNSLKLFISKAFTHYWKLISDQSRTIHNLRGSYETKMYIALGDIALEGKHKDKRTTIRHYLSKEETRRNLKGKSVFNIEI